MTLSFADDNEPGIQARRGTTHQPIQSAEAAVGTGDARVPTRGSTLILDAIKAAFSGFRNSVMSSN